MTQTVMRDSMLHARIAGTLYLLIILLGLWSELGVRMPLLNSTGSADWDQQLAEAMPRLRLSIVADAVMVACDVALAVILFQLLRGVNETIAMTAAALRLIQAATIAAAILVQIEALTVSPEQAERLLEVHSKGYDLGLIFFGLNTLLMSMLLYQSRYVARWLCHLLGLAGVVYLLGSLTRFLAPDLNAMIQPAYVIPVTAETALGLWLLIRGVKAPNNHSG